jgi:hypothetical protein
LWKILLADLDVVRNKGKFIPVTHHEGTERIGVIGPLTLNPDAGWCGWSNPRLGVFSPGKKLRNNWENTGGTQDQSRRILAKIKSLALLGVELRAVQPIASRGVVVGISLSYRNIMLA